MAGVIEQVQRPALVIAHNKTLAAQLCNEFREFFGENAVEYFVSYYDYYQPEAYVPAQDLYIEKDSSINDEIDRLRHSATAALLARRDVVIVASVSCIYGIGSPELYREQMQLFKVGESVQRDELFRKLIGMQYGRNDTNLTRGTFRVKGELLEVFPAYAETAYRIALFGDEVEGIQHFDPLTGEVLDEIDHVAVWPATHYVTKEETIERAVVQIQEELEERIGVARGERQAARGAPLAAADRVRRRAAQRARLLPGDRELLADHRRAGAGEPAAHPDRLLPRRLRGLRRRVAPDDPPARRHVRGRSLPQADARRPRIPAALGPRQPAASVRGVPQPGGAVGDGLGDPGRLRARVRVADRRADRAADRDRRSRGAGARDPQPDRRPDERGSPAGRGGGEDAGHDVDQEDGRGPDRLPLGARLPGPVSALGDRHPGANPDHSRPAAWGVRRPGRASTCSARASTCRRSRWWPSSTPTRRASCGARPA